MTLKLQKLKTLLNEVQDLRSVGDLLEWDQQTCMPSGGGESRAEQFATVKKLAHERFVADEIGQLLADLSAKGAAGDYDSDDASLVRYTKYEYDRKRKLPSALESEIAQHTSAAQEIWVKARAENNFKFFQPALEKMYDLKHQEAEAIGYSESIYDALLQEYERDMTAAQVKSVFDPLRAEIAPLVKAILPRVDSVSDACLHQPFDVDKQREFEATVIKQFGFDFGRGRVDVAVHPFEINFSPDDVRLTTRYDPNFLNPSLFGTMHEAGHGMYEQNVSPTIRRTPLCGGTSLGIHESQSRLWENLVGRSRGFWIHFYPKLQAAFPHLAAADLETFYRAVNRVSPSLIRVEADELTYSLHIMLRFEIEKEVLEGRVRVSDLPEVWNAKMQEYLGITPPNDKLGVLQDVHWAAGLVGYFPTYALGTIISVQLFERAIADVPGIPAQIERGEFSGLFNWLKDHVYRHGKKFTPTEVVERATGGPLNSAPYVKYLKTKFGEIYGV
ncbi:MAG TPA: carboxypeptidase M32 [Anaerolineales bacterium]|nr:carboxypeptidase M32 [Anaerolineales bacterium]